MTKCQECEDTGIIDRGNNAVPCDCPAGDKALFSHAGVKGAVTGAEIKRHFLNNSPDRIDLGPGFMNAEDLPGRKKKNPALRIVKD